MSFFLSLSICAQFLTLSSSNKMKTFKENMFRFMQTIEAINDHVEGNQIEIHNNINPFTPKIS